jgi:hypothetical protein
MLNFFIKSYFDRPRLVHQRSSARAQLGTQQSEEAVSRGFTRPLDSMILSEVTENPITVSCVGLQNEFAVFAQMTSARLIQAALKLAIPVQRCFGHKDIETHLKILTRLLLSDINCQHTNMPPSINSCPVVKVGIHQSKKCATMNRNNPTSHQNFP